MKTLLTLLLLIPSLSWGSIFSFIEDLSGNLLTCEQSGNEKNFLIIEFQKYEPSMIRLKKLGLMKPNDYERQMIAFFGLKLDELPKFYAMVNQSRDIITPSSSLKYLQMKDPSLYSTSDKTITIKGINFELFINRQTLLAEQYVTSTNDNGRLILLKCELNNKDRIKYLLNKQNEFENEDFNNYMEERNKIKESQQL